MGIKDLSSKLMSSLSGSGEQSRKDYFIYNKIVAFKGVIEGCGCSTLVANVAIELAKRGLKVCVVDTSIMYPSQFSLLKCEDEVGKVKDWFDLVISEDSGKVLKYGKLSSGVSILGFINRTINDALSTYDNEEVVTTAFTMLERLYDVVLVDVCGESTNITIASLIHSHIIYQVWSDDYSCISNIDRFITNMKFRCCNCSKMENVILNKMIVNSTSSLQSIMKKYNMRVIAEAPFSRLFYEKQCLGVPLIKIATEDTEVNAISRAVSSIADKIMGVGKFSDKVISAVDIVNGEVDGTLTKKYLDMDKEVDEIVENDMGYLNREHVDGGESDTTVLLEDSEDNEDNKKKIKRRKLRLPRKKGN